MPLHLLGKKSWNVYNKANIDKVRQDEAIAKAAEEAEEERMQALDAERRMQILRGEKPIAIPLDSPSSCISKYHQSDRSELSHRERKLRKKANENDTEFEMRVACQKFKEAKANRDKLSLTSSLIPHIASEQINVQRKNPEAEREALEKQREFEDQYTMRFSNAAGFKKSPGELPWYSKCEGSTIRDDKYKVCSKDVWGKDDPGRLQRENMRIMSNDPLVMMKAGASKVRELEREKKKMRGREKQRKYIEREGTKSHKRSRDLKEYENNDIVFESLDYPRIEHKRKKRDNTENHQYRSRNT